MPKPKLPLKKQTEELQKIKKLYTSTSHPYPIPNRLYHYIKKDAKKLIKKEIRRIKQEGLEISSPRKTTSFIDEKVNRPRGIYFWGIEIKKEVNIKVKVKDLDNQKLYAFPHKIADDILKLNKNYQIPNNFWANLKKITKPIPFKKYQGQFKAEFIYTSNIPPEMIEISREYQLISQYT